MDLPPYTESVYDMATYIRHREELCDPRTYLSSCLDLGGTDGADDWMFMLSGYGDKYHPIGLNICAAPMGSGHRVGSLLFHFEVNGEVITHWGNIDFDCVYADRAVISTPYWLYPSIALLCEILVVRPGCCRILFKFTNRGESEALRISPCAVLLGPDNLAKNLDGESISLQISEGYFVLRSDSNNEATIEPGAEGTFCYFLVAARDMEKAPGILEDAVSVDPDAFRREQYGQSHHPRLTTYPDFSDRQLARKVYNDLRANLTDFGDTFFSAPNKVIHKGQWLWDTCFHAFAWNLFNPDLAATLLKNLVANQSEDGFIPTSVDHVHSPNYGTTQPPLIAYAVDSLVKDTNLIAELYPKLEKFHRWLESNRRLPTGLYRWYTAGESGMDNSPRFDPVPGPPTTAADLDYCGREVIESVAHIDFACQMALFASSMSSLARKLGKSEDAAKWDAGYSELQDLINGFLYDERDGFYYDRLENGEWYRVKTVASFWPLIAGIPDQTQAESVVRHLMDPDQFFTPFPIPSVAINEPSFCFNYWRGPIWINTCYATILGLKRMGFDDEARQIGRRIVSGIKAELERSGQLWEIYDPIGGPARSLHKKYLGPRQNATGFAGWTANVLNILDEIGG